MMQLEMVLDDSMPPLQDYSVKVSRRARTVSLQVIPILGLQVTIPVRYPKREIPALIQENREWIEKQLQRIEQSVDPEFLIWPPQVLRLRAIDKTVSLRYLSEAPNVTAQAMRPVSLRGNFDGDELTVYGSPEDAAYGVANGRRRLIQLLSELLKTEARRHLEPLVRDHAAQNALVFDRLIIRGQRTLWGSYSSSGTLSLNYKLLFLPVEFSRYVILHELAHTRYLNHSAAFWRFLMSMEPDARRLDRELNAAGKLVPPWLERSG